MDGSSRTKEHQHQGHATQTTWLTGHSPLGTQGNTQPGLEVPCPIALQAGHPVLSVHSPGSLAQDPALPSTLCEAYPTGPLPRVLSPLFHKGDSCQL
jgi:hypothetical protein